MVLILLWDTFFGNTLIPKGYSQKPQHNFLGLNLNIVQVLLWDTFGNTILPKGYSQKPQHNFLGLNLNIVLFAFQFFGASKPVKSFGHRISVIYIDKDWNINPDFKFLG